MAKSVVFAAIAAIAALVDILRLLSSSYRRRHRLERDDWAWALVSEFLAVHLAERISCPSSSPESYRR